MRRLVLLVSCVLAVMISAVAAEEALTNQPPPSAPETAAVDAAPPAPRPKPVVTLVAKIDLAAQRLTVSQHGKVLHNWPISSGTRDFPSPVGSFKAQWMAKVWFSRKYDDAPMPHAVFFHEGAAIHATTAMHMLGRPASHGCIRLAPKNAETFYGMVAKNGLASTQIVVQGTPRWDPPAVARAPRPLPPIRYGFAAPRYGYPSAIVVQTSPYAGNRWQNSVFIPAAGVGPYPFRTR